MADDFIGLRKFKLNLKELTKPTRVVTTRGDVQALGTWIPEGVSFVITSEVSSEESQEQSGDEPRPERSGKRT